MLLVNLIYWISIPTVFFGVVRSQYPDEGYEYYEGIGQLYPGPYSNDYLIKAGLLDEELSYPNYPNYLPFIYTNQQVPQLQRTTHTLNAIKYIILQIKSAIELVNKKHELLVEHIKCILPRPPDNCTKHEPKNTPWDWGEFIPPEYKAETFFELQNPVFQAHFRSVVRVLHGAVEHINERQRLAFEFLSCSCQKNTTCSSKPILEGLFSGGIWQSLLNFPRPSFNWIFNKPHPFGGYIGGYFGAGTKPTSPNQGTVVGGNFSASIGSGAAKPSGGYFSSLFGSGSGPHGGGSFSISRPQGGGGGGGGGGFFAGGRPQGTPGLLGGLLPSGIYGGVSGGIGSVYGQGSVPAEGGTSGGFAGIASVGTLNGTGGFSGLATTSSTDPQGNIHVELSSAPNSNVNVTQGGGLSAGIEGGIALLQNENTRIRTPESGPEF